MLFDSLLHWMATSYWFLRVSLLAVGISDWKLTESGCLGWDTSVDMGRAI